MQVIIQTGVDRSITIHGACPPGANLVTDDLNNKTILDKLNNKSTVLHREQYVRGTKEWRGSRALEPDRPSES